MAVDTPHVPGSGPPLLVGRDRERAILGDLLIAALGGRGRPVLISGEAGIGKTALADTLGRDAKGRGALVLIGRCYDRTETPPYGLWSDLFARYYPWDGALSRDIPPPAFARRDALGTVASQAMLFDQVVDFARAAAARQPLVLILDDIHWSDPAGLDLLRVLARACTTLPLLLIATYRADEVAHDHPLAPLLPLLVREADAARLELRPLDEDALRAYAGGHYRLPEEDATSLAHYLSARTEGNPLFMTELLRTLEEDGILRRRDSGWALAALPQAGVPPLLRQVIEARLVRLGADAQRLLAIAAVIGAEVPLVLWQSVSGADETTLLDLVERAVAARVLDEAADGSAVAFAHALIRETLYEGMRATRRRTWHRAIAEALIASRSPDPDAVAYHLGATDDGRAVEWLIRAGERADAAFAYQTADARFTAALATLDADDGDRSLRCELLLVLSRLRRQRDPGQSAQFLETAVRLAREAGNLALMGEALFRLGLRRAYAGDRRRGIAQAEEGLLALTMASGDVAATRPARIAHASVSLVQGRGNLAVRVAEVGRFADAARYAEQVIATDEGGMTMETMNGWETLTVVARMMGRPMEARKRSTALWLFNRTQEEYDTARWFIGNELLWAALAFWSDDHRYLQQLESELNARPPESGEFFAGLPPLLHLPLLYLRGEWAAVWAVGEQVRQTRFAAHPFTQAIPLLLGRILVAQGDARAAWPLVHAEFPHGAATEPGDNRFPTAVALQRVAAELVIDAGDLAEARVWLEAHDRWLAWSGAVLGQAEGHLLWARYHRAAGDDDAAHERAIASSTAATSPRQPLVLIAAHRLLGEFATVAGRYDDADRHLDEATTLADACAASYERALTLLARAELRAATGNTTAALALIEEARTLCAHLGALPALARADTLAARLAAPPIGSPSRLPDGLTEREIAVLRLLASGSSNRETGAALGITARTVERHISNIYLKIGTDSRAEATTYAIRHALL